MIKKYYKVDVADAKTFTSVASLEEINYFTIAGCTYFSLIVKKKQ